MSDDYWNGLKSRADAIRREFWYSEIALLLHKQEEILKNPLIWLEEQGESREETT